MLIFGLSKFNTGSLPLHGILPVESVKPAYIKQKTGQVEKNFAAVHAQHITTPLTTMYTRPNGQYPWQPG